METEIKGREAFAYLELRLAPGESVVAESDAMSTMSTNIEMRAKLNGGFFGGLMRKFLGSESLFINTFSNTSQSVASMTLVQPYPGDLRCADIDGNELFMQPGAFVACTPDVKLKLTWAGFKSWLAKEGLFRFRVSGQGKVWYGAYGALLARELDGEAIVDTSHLVSYEPGVKLNIQLAGGIFSSFFGGEGLVTRISGKGHYVIQSRSMESLGGWLKPKI